MIKLVCLASGSSGNGYYLESDNEILILECGVKYKDFLKSIDFNISKTIGCVSTHIHKDHMGRVDEYADNGIQIYSSLDVVKEAKKIYKSNLNAVDYGKYIKLGNFLIQLFPLKHDVSCAGFLIKEESMGKLLFITDTQYCPYRFNELDHILIESNYSDKYLPRDEAKRDRVMKTHMSIDTACEFMEKNKSGSLRNVVLLHLSDGSSNELEFVRQAQSVVGNEVNVVAADNGVQVNLSLAPF